MNEMETHFPLPSYNSQIQVVIYASTNNRSCGIIVLC